MKILFLDIDGVIATPKQYNTVRTKLYSRDRHAEGLRVPYMWDERCVIALNRFLRMNDVEIVLSSDWRRHFTIDELDQIFKINGVAKSPIGITAKLNKNKLSEDLESIRVREINAYVEENGCHTWCAVDDMNLSALGSRFVQTDERMGMGQRDFVEKLEKSLYPNTTTTFQDSKVVAG